MVFSFSKLRQIIQIPSCYKTAEWLLIYYSS